jgi:hypothetical protein
MTDDAVRDLLADSFERIADLVDDVVDGAGPQQLTHRVDPAANPVSWLVWHQSRVQDDHVAGLARGDQAWTAEGWAERFALDLDDGDIGYGHDLEQVAQLDRATVDHLRGYHRAVHARTLAYLERVDRGELARVVDEAWDPPVTASVRLISVIGDALQHLGQAAYVRGVADRTVPLTLRNS